MSSTRWNKKYGRGASTYGKAKLRRACRFVGEGVEMCSNVFDVVDGWSGLVQALPSFPPSTGLCPSPWPSAFLFPCPFRVCPLRASTTTTLPSYATVIVPQKLPQIEALAGLASPFRPIAYSYRLFILPVTRRVRLIEHRIIMVGHRFQC